MIRARMFVAPGLCVLTCATIPAGARQGTPQNPPPKFVAGVDVVEMDVSVRDRDHKPLRGLTAQDFTVLEDGTPQKIVAFDEVHIALPAPPPAPWKRDVPKDVESNAVADKQLFVIVIDDAQFVPESKTGPGGAAGSAMSEVAYRIGTTRSIARKAIESLGDDDLAAIVFTQDSFNGQTFTSDRAKLLARLTSLALGPPYNVSVSDPSMTDCQPLWYASGALRMAVESLAAVAHRRKTILFISPGNYIPISGSPPHEYELCADKTQDAVLEAFRLAQAANVNVYTIDPSGLEVATNPGYLTEMDDRHNFLQEIAENTGGRAAFNTNDQVGHVAEAFDDSRSYYVLGYQLATRQTDGTVHRIDVKVNRQGGEVVSRRTRYDPAPPKPGAAGASTTTSAESAIGEFLPKPDFPADVSVSPFQSASGATVVVSIGGHLPPLSSPLASDHLDVVVRAFTADGRDAGAHQELVPVILTPPVSASDHPAAGPGFEFASKIQLTPGRYSLRIGLRSAATSKASSVYTDVTVPDFTKDPLSLSGVVFTASAGASRGDALASIVPTIRREFDPSARIQVFLRVYQGGTAAATDVSLRTRIVDEHNAPVLDHTEILPAQAFTRGRQADYFSRLPLSSLKPGEYWLALEATAGRGTMRRDLRFSVKSPRQ